MEDTLTMFEMPEACKFCYFLRNIDNKRICSLTNSIASIEEIEIKRMDNCPLMEEEEDEEDDDEESG